MGKSKKIIAITSTIILSISLLLNVKTKFINIQSNNRLNNLIKTENRIIVNNNPIDPDGQK